MYVCLLDGFAVASASDDGCRTSVMNRSQRTVEDKAEDPGFRLEVIP